MDAVNGADMFAVELQPLGRCLSEMITRLDIFRTVLRYCSTFRPSSAGVMRKSIRRKPPPPFPKQKKPTALWTFHTIPL